MDLSSHLIETVVFSELIYLAPEGRGIGSTSKERLQNGLKDESVKALIGDKWEVHSSNQDAGLFIYHDSKLCILSVRGTQELLRDSFNNVFPLISSYNLRSETTSKFFKSGIEYCKKKGYTIIVTGHSMGGSISKKLKNDYDVLAITYNAPDMHQFRSDVPISCEKERHYRLEGDAVSKLYANGGKPFSEQCGITLKYDSWNPYKAHKISNMKQVLIEHIKNDSGNLVLKDPKYNNKLDPASSGDLQKRINELQNVVNYVSNFMRESFPLIKDHHIKEANSSFQKSLINTFTYNIVSNGSVPKASVFIKNATIDYSLSLSNSVARDLLNSTVDNKLLSSTISNTCVNAIYSALNNDPKQARLAGINGTTTLISQLATSGKLPLSAGRIFNSTKSINRSETSIRQRDFVNYNSVGIHHDKIESTYYKNGHKVNRFSRTVGGHINFDGGDISLSSHTGSERSDVYQLIDGEDMISTWWEKDFKGGLRLTAVFNGKSISFKLLPEFKSHLKSYKSIKRADGGDIETKKFNLPFLNKDLSFIFENVSSSKNLEEVGKTLIDILETIVPEDGRTEHLKEILEVKHVKRKFFFFKKKSYDYHEFGHTCDVKSEWTNGINNNSTHGEEVYGNVKTEIEYRSYEKKNNQKTKDVKTEASTVNTKLYAKTNKKSYRSLNLKRYNNDGSVTRTEEYDTLRKVVEKITNDNNNIQTENKVAESFLGDSISETKYPEEKIKNSNETVTKQVKVTRNEKYEDLRNQKSFDSNGNVINEEYFKIGEKRVANGVETTKVIEKKGLKYNSFQPKKEKKITESQRKYSYNNGEYNYTDEVNESVSYVEEKPVSGVKGLIFVEEIKKKESGEIQDRSIKLNQGAEQAIAVGVSSGLTRIFDIYDKWKDGEADLTYIIKSLSEYKVDIFENYFIGSAGQLVSVTEVPADGFLIVVGIVGLSQIIRFFIREFYEYAKSKKNKDQIIKENKNEESIINEWIIRFSSSQELIDLLTSIIKGIVNLSIIGSKVKYGYLLTFATSQIIKSLQKLLTESSKKDLSWETIKSCFNKQFLKKIGSSLLNYETYKNSQFVWEIGSTLIGYGASILCAGAIGFLGGGSLISIIIPTFASWGISKFIMSNFNDRKYRNMLNKYGLDKNSTLSDARIKFRRYSLKYHPDKGGSNEAFHKLQNDFEEIFKYYKRKMKKRDKQRTIIESLLNIVKNLFKFKKVKKLEEKLNEIDDEAIKSEENIDRFGFVNKGNTCYLNSILQCLSNTKPLCDYFFSKLFNGRDIISCFQRLLFDMRNYKNPVDPEELFNYIDKMYNFNTQHDAHEFLLYILQKLHGSLKNLRDDDNDMFNYSYKDNNDEIWNDYMKREGSAITDIFDGLFKIYIKCTKCNNETINIQSMRCLSLPIIDDKEMNLNSSFSVYMNEDDVEISCSKCKNKKGKKNIKIYKPPRVLIIHFNRFYFSNNEPKKICDFINFPECFEINNEYVDSSIIKEYEYELFATSNHMGNSVYEGHYYTIIKDLSENRWYCYSDQDCYPINNLDNLKQDAYICFYQLKESVKDNREVGIKGIMSYINEAHENLNKIAGLIPKLYKMVINLFLKKMIS